MNSSEWIWCPQPDDKVVFRHPSELPMDEAGLQAFYDHGKRGPSIAQIKHVTLLQNNGKTVIIADKGATREVPKEILLPWYEGLLLIDALRRQQDRKWCDAELLGILEAERKKLRISGATWIDKKMFNIAVTGAGYIDIDGQKWNHRRTNVRDSNITLLPGQDCKDLFRVVEICEYKPPWEAYCHSKCGVYQDFYRVRWTGPVANVQLDYSSTENGSEELGTTWEPDECLPSSLDSMRLNAKRLWIKEQKNREEERRRAHTAKRSAEAEIKQQAEVDQGSKRARMFGSMKRDKTPLDQDLVKHTIGHDLIGAVADGEVKTGWPRRPEDYPAGYGVANPPGFCTRTCDCMDDARFQAKWEIEKKWLDDVSRESSVQAAMGAFEAQKGMVVKRGSVTQQWRFEGLLQQAPDQRYTKPAHDLSELIAQHMIAVLNEIPYFELAKIGGNVRVPFSAYLADALDCEPLRYELVDSSGDPMKLPWLNLNSETGELTVTDYSVVPAEDTPLLIAIRHIEGLAMTIKCQLSPTKEQPWLRAGAKVVKSFNDLRTCTLDLGVRGVLTEHISELVDFSLNQVHACGLGRWLEVMECVLRLSRTAAVANVCRDRDASSPT